MPKCGYALLDRTHVVGGNITRRICFMKFSKIASAAAAIAAAGMMSAVASAGCLVPAKNPTPALGSDAAMWLLQLYNEGNEAENKPATERDLDYSKVAKVAFTVTVVDDGNREMFSGQLGGGVILSINGGDIVKDSDLFKKYNWPSHNFWGVNDPDLELTAAEDQAVQGEKVGDYSYKFTSNVFENPLGNGDVSKIGCMQVGFQEWGSEMFATVTIDKLEVLDANDNVLMTFDGDGNEVAGSSAPADNTGSTPSNNVDTGVESLAVVVGVAALAAGTVVLSRKRK